MSVSAWQIFKTEPAFFDSDDKHNQNGDETAGTQIDSVRGTVNLCQLTQFTPFPNMT